MSKQVMMNEQRAAWANAAILAFQTVCVTDNQDALCDLLCNLMHWADSRDISFSDEFERAYRHYRTEILEDKDLPYRDAWQKALTSPKA